jgi:putative membrane protein
VNESSIAAGDLRVREHLANERTYLAWLRTSLAMMAFGLGAAKFGSHNEVYAFAAGGVLVGAAIAGFGYATVRYRALNQEITRGSRVVIGASAHGPIAAAMVLVLAAFIALVLLVR